MNQQKNLYLPESDPPEKRDPRRRMLKTAVASYNNRSISIEVVVRDFSESGVRLKLKENDLLPDRFTLYIELDGILVDCEAVWRRGLEIGARFVSEIANTAPLRCQTVSPIRKRRISILKKPMAT